jgi:divalent metal cation (Fe/Co/Zn/Cd) transporter
MIISIIIKLWQGIFYRKMAKAINSDALIASSKDSLNDSLSTSVVIIGLIIIKFVMELFLKREGDKGRREKNKLL